MNALPLQHFFFTNLWNILYKYARKLLQSTEIWCQVSLTVEISLGKLSSVINSLF